MVLYKRRHHKYLETSLSIVYTKENKNEKQNRKKKTRNKTKRKKITKIQTGRYKSSTNPPFSIYHIYNVYIVFLKARDRTASFSLQQVSSLAQFSLALFVSLFLSRLVSNIIEVRWNAKQQV